MATDIVAERLQQTQQAFDSVAADYDGPRGNNTLIQEMRATVWHVLERTFPRGSRLLDLGCGTGIDAVRLAAAGRHVVATDWSPLMVARTTARAAAEGVAGRVQALHVGLHELDRLHGPFDGAYSNFGPLNCAPDLAGVAEACARLVRPGGHLVFSVIGRVCPWEYVYYRVQGRHERACVRSLPGQVSVNLNRHTVWTSYYRPLEFYAAFLGRFELRWYRPLALFVPPPYLVAWRDRHPRAFRVLRWLDDHVGGWPGLRNWGDHFLIHMTRRAG